MIAGSFGWPRANLVVVERPKGDCNGLGRKDCGVENLATGSRLLPGGEHFLPAKGAFVHELELHGGRLPG